MVKLSLVRNLRAETLLLATPDYFLFSYSCIFTFAGIGSYNCNSFTRKFLARHGKPLVSSEGSLEFFSSHISKLGYLNLDMIIATLLFIKLNFGCLVNIFTFCSIGIIDMSYIKRRKKYKKGR